MCIASNDHFVSQFIGFKIMFLARIKGGSCIALPQRLITQLITIILRPIAKIAPILMLTIAFMLLFHTFSFAFFSTESTEQPLKKVITNTDARQLTFSHYLIWTDNDKSHLQINSANSDLANASDHYISAFYMPIIEIVTQQRETYVPTEFSVENLLYANLKLKSLLNEYNLLKERSESILKGLDVPYISQSSGFKPNSKKEEFPISYKINEVADHINILAGPILKGHGATDTIGNGNFQHKQQSGRQRLPNKLREPLNYSSDTALTKSLTFRSRRGSPHGS
jgi:hypothetical protein